MAPIYLDVKWSTETWHLNLVPGTHAWTHDLTFAFCPLPFALTIFSGEQTPAAGR